MLARLVQILGGLVGGVFAGKDLGDLVAGFSSLADRITPEQMDYFCDVFAPLTQVSYDGKTPLLSDVFDDHFAANYADMVDWLTFCLKVNFESFLGGKGGIAAIIAALTAKGGSPSESLKVSTGTSTGS